MHKSVPASRTKEETPSKNLNSNDSVIKATSKAQGWVDSFLFSRLLMNEAELFPKARVSTAHISGQLHPFQVNCIAIDRNRCALSR